MYVCLHGSRLLIFFFLLPSWKAPHFFNIATKGEAATKTEAILSPFDLSFAFSHLVNKKRNERNVGLTEAHLMVLSKLEGTFSNVCYMIPICNAG